MQVTHVIADAIVVDVVVVVMVDGVLSLSFVNSIHTKPHQTKTNQQDSRRPTRTTTATER